MALDASYFQGAGAMVTHHVLPVGHSITRWIARLLRRILPKDGTDMVRQVEQNFVTF
jgi:hypothetical protein